MTIRPATISDLPQLSLLKRPKDEEHRIAYETTARERVEQTQTSDDAIFLVLEEDTKILGQVFLRLHGNETQPGYPNMQDLYILESHRGEGLGSQLITECERAVKVSGHTKISVAVNPTLNPRAKALYEWLGYHDVGNEPYLDGVYDGNEDWVVDLEKNL